MTHIIIKKEVHDEKELPDYLKKCISKIKSDKLGDDLVNDFETIYTLDEFFKRVFFNVDEMHLELHNLKVWSMMHLYYGFEVEYDSESKLFKIGGYETEEITAKTLSSLINKIEKQFNKDNKNV